MLQQSNLLLTGKDSSQQHKGQNSAYFRPEFSGSKVDIGLFGILGVNWRPMGSRQQ